jgi:hypothetical protein
MTIPRQVVEAGRNVYLSLVEGWLRDHPGIVFTEGSVDDLCTRIAIRLGVQRPEDVALREALRAMLDTHGKPHREEWINDAAFEHARRVDAQARAVLSLPHTGQPQEGTRERVVRWHERNGGHNGRLAGHALRMLHEVIEVCVSAGSDRAEIEGRVASELDKAERKGEFTAEVTLQAVREELADVGFLVDVLAHHTGNVDLEVERLAKLEILDRREWEADTDGVLWRPGHLPAAPASPRAEGE